MWMWIHRLHTHTLTDVRYNWSRPGFTNVLREILSYEEVLTHIFYLIRKSFEWVCNVLYYIHIFCCRARNTKATAALGELTLVSRAAELINSVGHFCLLIFVCGICCRQGCLEVEPWAFLRALWTWVYWGISLIFSLHFSLFTLYYSLLGIIVLGRSG